MICVFIYEGNALKSVVKQQYKIHLPAPGENPIGAAIFNLLRDPREERPVESIKFGIWAGGQFVSMVKRHLLFRRIHPNRPPVHDVPYKGIANLRPETKAFVKAFLASLPKKPKK